MLSQPEFESDWQRLGRISEIGPWFNRLMYSTELEIQDVEANTERGLKIMDQLHEANIRMRYYELVCHRFGKFVEKNIKEDEAFSILEVGSGHGHVICGLEKRLKKRFPNASFHGMDLMPAYVELARKNAEIEGADVTFFCDDAMNLADSAKEQYDFVIMSMVAHHMLPFDLYKFLATMSPGIGKGLFIVDVQRRTMNILKSIAFSIGNSAYTRDFRHDAILSMRRSYTVDELTWIMTSAPGFHDVKVSELDAVFLSAEGLCS